MPTTYAHWLFGDRCIATLPSQYQNIVQKYRNEFNYGVQGPDLFFYYKCLAPNEVNRYGYQIHNVAFRDLMEGFREGLNKAKDKEGSLSYLLGFLCHFTLDSYCHSYVEVKEKKTGPSHAKIESQLDRYLMEKDGLDPIRFKPSSTLHPTKNCAENIQALYPHFSFKVVHQSMKDQVLILNLLKDNNVPKRKLITTVLGHLKLNEYLDLMIGEKNEELCKDSNLRLEKLMGKALEVYPELFGQLMDYLEKNIKLPPYFKNHFNQKPGWEEIPVLSYEEELKYEVKRQD